MYSNSTLLHISRQVLKERSLGYSIGKIILMEGYGGDNVQNEKKKMFAK